MNVTIDFLPEFERRAKALAKKCDHLQCTKADNRLITLMSIYDKSEIDNVSDAYLRQLVQSIENRRNK